MRKRFSEKHGFKDIRDALQVESMDDALTSRLWNYIQKYFLDPINMDYNYRMTNSRDTSFTKSLYDGFFKINEDPYLRKDSFMKNFKEKYFRLQWYEIYDLVEYIPEIHYDAERCTNFRNEINELLEAEMSGYRFVENYIAPIVDEVEITEIEEAMGCGLDGAKQHISNAIEHLSDRESPNYVNSIKESISAVESVCKGFLGNNSALGSCLNQIDYGFSPNFKAGMSKLYGWTSQDGGIRHGANGDEIIISFEDAKYMLVICSAFVNYLIAKKANSDNQ